MSVIRELEERINAHAGVLPYSVIIHDVMRVNDWPIEVQLNNDLYTAFASYYARVADMKQFDKEMGKQDDIEDAETD